MTRLRRPRIMATAIIAAVVLAGCSSTPEAAPSAVPAPRPTVSAEPAGVTAPHPLVDASCSDLVDADQLASLASTAVSLRDRSFMWDEAGFGIPQSYSIRHEQGTTCTWTNGIERDPETGDSQGVAAIEIAFLPEAAVTYGTYLDIYGPESAVPRCWGDLGSPYCAWDGIASDDTWISIHVTGTSGVGGDAGATERFTAFIATLVERTETAPRAMAWTAAASRLLPPGCPGILTADIVAAVFGDGGAGARFYSGPIGGTGLPFEAELSAGSDPCRWWTPATTSEYGSEVQVLVGGEWAWNDARERIPEIAAATPLALDGLAGNDTAWVRGDESRTIDMVIGGNWISATIWKEDFEALGGDAETITALAQAMLDSLA